MISVLLGVPPSRTSSVASSHRRYEGGIKNGDDLHEADSPNTNDRRRARVARVARTGGHDTSPSAAWIRIVFPKPDAPLPSRHSAPSTLPTVASSVPSVPAPSEPVPNVVVTIVGPASTPPAPCRRFSSPRALVPFHHEDLSLWP